MNLNLTTDFHTFDGLETVDFLSRQAGGTTFAAAVSCTHAMRRALTKVDESVSGGALVAGRDLVWHVSAVDLGSTVPKVSDVVRDSAGVRWSVVKVEVQTQASRYRLTCTREV